MTSPKPINMEPKNQKTLLIPVQLIGEVFSIKKVNEFKVFVGAKWLTSGMLVKGSHQFEKVCEFVRIKKRTVLKHLDTLVGMKWVGYNKVTKTYYLRSWSWFREQELFFNRLSVTFLPDYMSTFRAYLAGSLIGMSIINIENAFKYMLKESGDKREQMKYKHRKRGRKFAESVINIRGLTQQDSASSPSNRFQMPEYFGLSNKGIAKLLNCSSTTACDIKNEAEKAGYIKTKAHYTEVYRLSEPDYAIRK